MKKLKKVMCIILTFSLMVGGMTTLASAETTMNYDKLPQELQIKEIKAESDALIYGSYSSYKVVDIILNNGESLSTSYYRCNRQDGKIGPVDYEVSFRGKYQGYPNQTVTVYVKHKPPTNISFSTGDNQKTGMKPIAFYPQVNSDFTYKTKINVSRNKDMSNATSKVFDGLNGSNYFGGLSQNTQYYVTAQIGVKGKDNNFHYSDATGVESFHTAQAIKNPTLQNTKDEYAQMRKFKTFRISGYYDLSDVSAYRSRIYNMYDYYFYQNGSRAYEIGYGDGGKGGVVKDIVFKVGNANQIKSCLQTQKKVNSIVNGAKKKKSNAAKVKYVNKRIKKICSYHWAAYRAHKKGNFPKKYNVAYEAYGCLVNHKAVCSGYSEAFKWCMNDLGIENKYQHGKNHIWNIVKIKYKKQTRWWVVDVTWNDCLHRDKYLLKKKH